MISPEGTGIALDASIQYHRPIGENADHPATILLTGATGLLGANLLGNLLERTDADIYCLVRADNKELGRARIREQLQFYKFWRDTYNRRIKPVLGNLEKNRLGLDEKKFRQLAAEIDVIYHCGASTNLILPYDRLYGVNVASTEWLLKLASMHHTKPFHYVSTISVLPKRDQNNNKIKVMLERYGPSTNIDDFGGYVATKAVSEHLVRQAMERGLPASIYRIGRIMGDSINGRISSAMNIPAIIWKACILLEMAPAVEKDWTFVPVDFASQAIVHLSSQPQLLGGCFHVVSRYSISWKSIFEITREYGYPLKQVTLHKWLEKISSPQLDSIWRGNDAAVEISLLHSAAKGFFSPGNLDISTFHFLEGLKNSSVESPPIDARLMRSYLRWFERSGFLPSSPPSNIVDKWRRRSAAKA